MTRIFLVTLTTPALSILFVTLCYICLVNCIELCFASEPKRRFFNFARRTQPYTFSIIIYTLAFIPTITFCQFILLTFVLSNTFIPPIYIVTLDPNYLKPHAPHLVILTFVFQFSLHTVAKGRCKTNQVTLRLQLE